MVVMPGGVDIHSHVASSSVNLARRLLPEEHLADPAPAPDLIDRCRRSGSGGTVPTTFTTGYRYAGLGYTTVFDAAVAPVTARLSHAEFDDTPIVDGGFFVLLGNDEYLLRLIDAGDREQAREYAAWVMSATGRLRDQDRQSRGRRTLETRRARAHRARYADRIVAGHAPRDPRNARRRGQRARAATRGAHPLQQPGRRRQRGDHARQHAGGRGTSRALHAPAVSRVFRDSRRRVAVSARGS